MVERSFFSFLLFFVVSFSFASLSAGDRPNVIIVMPDDMGYGDTGATGNSVIRTPNLDRLSAASAQLTDFYVSPVCSPTRASLMTGRYNYRTRVIDTFKGRSMMEPEEVTVAEVLQDSGYATGIFGKWHLGDNYPLRPQDQGFDEVLIHRGGGLAQPSEPIANERRYTDPILIHNGEKVETEGYCTDIYFDAAIDFMRESREEGRPFFVYLPPNAPHGPYHDVPEDLLDYYQSIDLSPILNGNESEKHKDTVARVFAMIENIDQNMGKLDAYLEESGELDNTIVMFFVDNGPNTMRYVGPFRGMKSHVHEGGIRSMFFARWPDGFEAGTKSDRVAAHIDVMPTVLDAAGVGIPEGLQLDGRSLLPVLQGEEGNWEDRALVIQSHRGNEPVPFHHFALRTQDWKLLRGTGFGLESLEGKPDLPPFELYKISSDPGEEVDLATTEPEKLSELKGAYKTWLEDVSSTRENNYAPPRIHVGSDKETVSDLSIQDWRVGEEEGWGINGKWLISVDAEADYEVELRWDEPIGAREFVLTIGKATFDVTLAEGETKAKVSEVSLDPGETTVSVSPKEGSLKRDEILRFVTFTRG